MQPGTTPLALWAVGHLPRSSQGRVTEKEEKPAQSVLRDAICGKAHKAELHAYKHTCVHAHVHTCTHTHMHTRVDACTHTQVQRESSGLTCTQRRMAVPLERWGGKGISVSAQSEFSCYKFIRKPLADLKGKQAGTDYMVVGGKRQCK